MGSFSNLLAGFIQPLRNSVEKLFPNRAIKKRFTRDTLWVLRVARLQGGDIIASVHPHFQRILVREVFRSRTTRVFVVFMAQLIAQNDTSETDLKSRIF